MEKEQKYSKNDCQSKVNMFSWPWRTKERETAEYWISVLVMGKRLKKKKPVYCVLRKNINKFDYWFGVEFTMYFFVFCLENKKLVLKPI